MINKLTLHEANEVLRHTGFMGHDYAVIAPCEKNGYHPFGWRSVAECSTPKAARRIARDFKGSRIYSRSETGWIRRQKRAPFANAGANN